jgi:hypothetical protein
MKKNNSTVEKVHADLDIDEHLKMQEKGWQVQAVGILCMFVFILSAALGLYGDGIVSNQNLNKNEASIEYDRFFRFEAKMNFKVKATGIGNTSISFPTKYLNHFEISSIVPEPNESRFSDARVEYVFNGRDVAEITFYLIPQEFGRIQGSIKVNENVFAVNHFIFP